jgi:hypothetical protein
MGTGGYTTGKQRPLGLKLIEQDESLATLAPARSAGEVVLRETQDVVVTRQGYCRQPPSKPQNLPIEPLPSLSSERLEPLMSLFHFISLEALPGGLQ